MFSYDSTASPKQVDYGRPWIHSKLWRKKLAGWHATRDNFLIKDFCKKNRVISQHVSIIVIVSNDTPFSFLW